MMKLLIGFLFLALPVFAEPASAEDADTSAHKVRFVTTDDHVKLEMLDWGGTGRPLVFLVGLGGTAHVFDKFALQFTGKHHVYGITRRGFGASDRPAPTLDNYDADRLGDDVLAVIEALKLDRPVLVGHSIAGEELSSIGTRHPEKTAGLVYLDAGYAYGFYAPGNLIPLGSNLTIDANDFNRKQLQMNRAGLTPQAAAILDDLNRTSLPQLKADLAATGRAMKEMRKFLPGAGASPQTPQGKTNQAILAGQQKYTDIKAPVLAIFAVPKPIPADESTALKSIDRVQNVQGAEQVKRFEAGNPSAKVIRIANARHDVFNSNTADVVREMNAFLDHLN